MSEATSASSPSRGEAPLSETTKIAYATGNLGKSIQWNAVDLLYLFFLTEVVGLSPAEAGLVILVSLVWDGISDPAAGFVIDRYRTTFGSYQRQILLMAPLSMLGFVAIFLIPVSLTEQPLLGALIAGIVFRTGYTLVDIPHNALLAQISNNSRERSSISAYRFFFSSVGAIVISVAAIPALRTDAASPVSAFVVFAIVVSGVYLLAMWTSAFGARGIVPAAATTARPRSLRSVVGDILRNRRLVRVVIVAGIVALCLPAFSRLATYYAKSWLGDAAHASTLFIVFVVAQILSLPFWLRVSNRTEKKRAAIFALTLFAATCLVFLWYPASDLLSTAICFALAGFAFGGVNTMTWAMVPDTIEYTEQQSGHRYEAATFGLLLLVIKVCSGVSVAMSGWSLDLIGYESARDAAAPLTGLAWAMALPPLVGALLGIVLLRGLRLSHAEHDDVVRRLG